MKRKSANSRRHKKNFTRTAMREDKKNRMIPRAGYRL